jgi:Protein of unknown function (DUF454)
VSHPVFGRHIADYLAGRGLRARAKVVALATLWTSVLLSVVVFVPLLMVDALLLAVASAVSVYLLRLPTSAPDSDASETGTCGAASWEVRQLPGTTEADRGCGPTDTS